MHAKAKKCSTQGSDRPRVDMYLQGDTGEESRGAGR